MPKQTVQFPEGPREIDGKFVRRDHLRGVEFLVDHPYYSVEIWAPDTPYEGFRFRQNPDETWTAEAK